MSDEEYMPAGILVTGTGREKKVAARLTKKFEPKTWKPLYDQFIYWHVIGKSNIWIAEKYEYTTQQICNILTSNQGKLRKEIIASNLRTQQTETISARLENVADKFMRRIEAVADDVDLFEKAPFAVIDRGLTILKNLNHLKGGSSDSHGGTNGGSSVVNNTQIHQDNRKITVFGEKAINELRDAIRFSDEAKAQHSLENLEDSMNIVTTAVVSDKTKTPIAIGTPITTPIPDIPAIALKKVG